ncbi:MAG: hypothetical protein V9H69_02720 [Anaerolineae bacterium]
MNATMELSRVRQGWSEIDALETEILRRLTMEAGIEQYLALQAEFEPQLQASEPYFRQQRNDALAQLQARLLTLNRKNGAVMEDLVRSVARLQQRLEQAGIPSAVIGGLAVSAWGEPRLTRDANLKVLARRDERGRILQLLADFTPLHADPDEALRRNGVAFFQDPAGARIDIMLAETSFDETVIGRASLIELQPELVVRVCSAEDLIVYKSVSLRTQDRFDVEGIIRRQGDRLDDRYVEDWLRQFEQALDDSTLVAEYRRLRQQFA